MKSHIYIYIHFMEVIKGDIYAEISPYLSDFISSGV